ncbi:MAG: hypothetical protein IT369_19750 [Candidatus Latescibacteria bacterium]|nr:hypothetical protein [Candidatus Latescibacterota bacterium]
MLLSSSTENPNWRRWARIALVLSAFLHLLFFLCLDLVYNPLAPPERGYRVLLKPPTTFTFSQPTLSLAPSRLPIPTFSPDGATGPGQTPSLGMGGQPEGEGTGPGIIGVAGLPAGQPGAGDARGEKAAVFPVPALPDLDYDRFLIEKLLQEVAEREQYARFHLLDADTTDDESQRRSRARQIVERAIAAMGGREALGRIKEMKVRVWLESRTSCWSGPPVDVPPFVYPVAIWTCTAQGTSTRQRIAVKISLDPKLPNPDYVFRLPCGLGSYQALFDTRWRFPPTATPRAVPEVQSLQEAGRLRERGETARWHFLDHFLGDGVRIEYLGTEHLAGRLSENNQAGRLAAVIQVQDDHYGNLQEAYFDEESGLLLATVDGLTTQEKEWFRTAYRRGPPTWTTVYDRYRPVRGVLTPHRWVRSGEVVHLQIAYNGEEPSLAEPQIDE